jgi:hypothetical protein
MTSDTEQDQEATFNLLNCELIGEFDRNMAETFVNENDHCVREDRFVHHEPDDILKFIESNQNANTLKKDTF